MNFKTFIGKAIDKMKRVFDRKPEIRVAPVAFEPKKAKCKHRASGRLTRRQAQIKKNRRVMAKHSRQINYGLRSN